MITVTDTKGQKHHLALDAIAKISRKLCGGSNVVTV